MNDDDKLIQNLQNKVKKSQSTLDATTLGQLRAARRTALESVKNKPNLGALLKSKLFRGPFTKNYVLSSVVLIILTVGFTFTIVTVDEPTEHYDIDIVAISEEFELLEELDFYLWIANSVEHES